MLHSVDIHVRKGKVLVTADRAKYRKAIGAGETERVPIQKDRPVIVVAPDGARATVRSATKQSLIVEHEDADGFVEESKVKPSEDKALTVGKWVVMAPKAK